MNLYDLNIYNIYIIYNMYNMYNIYFFRTEIDIETLKQHKDMAVLSVSPVSYPERLAF